MTDFKPFIGHQLIDVEDDIHRLCDAHGWLFAAMDPGSPKNTDVEPDRLNVITDRNFRIIDIHLG